MSSYICRCQVKVRDEKFDEEIGFGFEHYGIFECKFIEDEWNKDKFAKIIDLTTFFKKLTKSRLASEELDLLEIFLKKATEGIMTEIEIGDDYDYSDIYLNVSINKLEKFIDEDDLHRGWYLGYINIDSDTQDEGDVIDYVLSNEQEGSFDEWDVDNGYVELERLADGCWIVQVGHA